MLHLQGKRNINCKLHDFCSIWALGARPKLPKFDTFQKSSKISSFAHLTEKLNDVNQKALYQTVNFMSPWNGSLTSERGHIHVNGLHNYGIKCFKNLLIETDCTFGENINPSTKTVNFMSLQIEFWHQDGDKMAYQSYCT